jgi:hypothetical protein
MTDLILGTTNRRLDTLAVEQGVERECDPLRPGLFVTILPAGTFNPRFRSAIQERVERMAERNGKGEDSDALDRYDDPAFVVQALVLSMRGIRKADGTEVEYTSEVGMRALSDPGNADVLGWIVNEAHVYTRYYTQGVEADAKNSPTGSGGRQAGVGKSEKIQS